MANKKKKEETGVVAENAATSTASGEKQNPLENNNEYNPEAQREFESNILDRAGESGENTPTVTPGISTGAENEKMVGSMTESEAAAQQQRLAEQGDTAVEQSNVKPLETKQLNQDTSDINGDIAERNKAIVANNESQEAINERMANRAKAEFRDADPRDLYKGYNVGTYNGRQYFEDENGKKQAVIFDTLPNGDVYNRIPGSTDLIIVHKDGTTERVTEKDYQDVKYEGLSALRRKQMIAADRVQRLYKEWRDTHDRMPTENEVDAILRGLDKNDMWRWQTIYGNKKGRWNTALGGGAYFGNVNADNMKDLEEQYQAEKQAEDDATSVMQDALQTRDENGLLKGGKIVTNVTLPDGTEKEVTSDQANKLVDYIHKWGNDPRALTKDEVDGLQQLLNELGMEVKLDGINGAQTMNAIVDYLMSSKNPNSDAVADILEAAGIVDNGDGTYFIPKEMTWDDVQEMHDEQKRQADLRTQQREIERAKNRTGFADLAAGIGDMIRASEGARVDPRDWKPRYDQLDARGQELFKTYQAKTELLRRERLEKEKAAREAEQAYRSQLLKNKNELDKINLGKQWDRTIAGDKAAADAALQGQKDAAAMARVKEQGRNALEVAKQNGADKITIQSMKNAVEKPGKFSVGIDGTAYSFPESTQYAANNDMYGIIEKWAEKNDDAKASLRTLKLAFGNQANSEGAVNIIVGSFLQMYPNCISAEDKKRIIEQYGGTPYKAEVADDEEEEEEENNGTQGTTGGKVRG